MHLGGVQSGGWFGLNLQFRLSHTINSSGKVKACPQAKYTLRTCLQRHIVIMMWKATKRWKGVQAEEQDEDTRHSTALLLGLERDLQVDCMQQIASPNSNDRRNRLALLNLSRKQETLTELIEFFGMRGRGSLIVKRNEEPRG